MKKVYTKPEIMFEDFSLSTMIASCGNEATHDASLGKWGCKGYYDDQFGVVLFTSDFNGCKYVEADGDFNGYCYDVPQISLNLFGS